MPPRFQTNPALELAFELAAGLHKTYAELVHGRGGPLGAVEYTGWEQYRRVILDRKHRLHEATPPQEIVSWWPH